ncbi:MAG: ComEC/Rec2 family competence protein [Eubacteriales bacterium]
MRKIQYRALAAVIAVICLLFCLASCREETSAGNATDTEKITETSSESESTAWEDPDGLVTFFGLPKYSTKDGVKGSVNCGPGLAGDSQSGSAEDSYMVSITGTTYDEFKNYIALISLERVDFGSDEAGEYYTFKGKSSNFYYIYYNQFDDSVKIIEDNSSTLPAAAISYGEENGSVSVYQYSLNYTNSDITYAEPKNVMDCGMMYMIRFPDNSVMLIDSGHSNQATEATVNDIYAFLKEITGGEKINIRAWFFTHAHGDHCYLASKLIGAYADKLNVQTVMFNFPSYRIASNGYDLKSASEMKTAMRKNYPDADYIKLHRGQSFNFFGVSFDVLYTWEDTVTADGEWTITNFNSTSTVLKMTYKGKSLMFLGDLHTQGQDALLKGYGKSTLKSDVVQASHHGYNILSVYSMIQADIVLVPNSRQNSVNIGGYSQYSKYADEADILFADVYTYELIFSDAPIQIIQHDTRQTESQ